MLRIAPSKATHLAADKADEKKAVATYGKRQVQHPETAPMYQEMRQDEMDHAAKLGAAQGQTDDAGEDPASAALGMDPDNAGGSDQSADMDPETPDLPKLSIQLTGYLPPTEGPFECEHCIYWSGPDSCHIVEGKLDPHGCCNLFSKNPDPAKQEGAEDEDEESPEVEGNEQ